MALVQHTTTPGAVARAHGLTESSVRRHAANHITTQLATLATRIDALGADAILGAIVRLYERGLETLAKAESSWDEANQAKAIPALIRESRANLDAMARVSIALADARDNDVVVVENTLERDIAAALAARRVREDVSPGGNSTSPRISQALNAGTEDAEVVEP